MQGIVGETYNRMLAGEAVNDPESPLFVPDDYKFHGQGPEEHYRVDSYFGEHAYSAFGKERKRVLIEGDGELSAMAFPLRASGRPGRAGPAAQRRLLEGVVAATARSRLARRTRRMGRL